MRAFLFRFAPPTFLLATGLLVCGPSASGQEVVGARPIERAPPVVTTYPTTHVDIRPLPQLPTTPTLSAPIGNTPSCCGGTSTSSTGSESGSGDAEAAASPADNDALAGSVVDTMIGELPIVGKQRSAE